MSEKYKKESEFEPSEVAFILSPEDAINFVRKHGYLMLSQSDQEGIEIDRDVLSQKIDEEGFKTKGVLNQNQKTKIVKLKN